jgi:hypothetical protein
MSLLCAMLPYAESDKARDPLNSSALGLEAGWSEYRWVGVFFPAWSPVRMQLLNPGPQGGAACARNATLFLIFFNLILFKFQLL